MGNGIPELGLPPFADLDALQVFDKVSDILRYAGGLESGGDCEIWGDELEETIYSVAEAVRDAYVRDIKTFNSLLFERVNFSLSEFRSLVTGQYKDKIDLIIGSLENHQERKAMNYAKYSPTKRNRFE